MSGPQVTERHEWACGRSLFNDLPCGCDGGPYVTENELVAGAITAECAHPAVGIVLTPTGFVCACGAAVAFVTERPQTPKP